MSSSKKSLTRSIPALAKVRIVLSLRTAFCQRRVPELLVLSQPWLLLAVLERRPTFCRREPFGDGTAAAAGASVRRLEGRRRSVAEALGGGALEHCRRAHFGARTLR